MCGILIFRLCCSCESCCWEVVIVVVLVLCLSVVVLIYSMVVLFCGSI